eukprot:6180539-Pleurochrysis_carterae.AAC.2
MRDAAKVAWAAAKSADGDGARELDVNYAIHAWHPRHRRAQPVAMLLAAHALRAGICQTSSAARQRACGAQLLPEQRNYQQKGGTDLLEELSSLQLKEVEVKQQLAGARADISALRAKETNRLCAEARDQRANARFTGASTAAAAAALSAAEKRESAAAAHAECAQVAAAAAQAEADTLMARVCRAEAARDAAQSERNAAAAERDIAAYEADLLRRKLEWAMEKVSRLPRPLPSSRTADELAALLRVPAWLAAWRERSYLKELLEGHDWRAVDIAHTLSELGYMELLFETKHAQREHMRRVGDMIAMLEKKHFGDGFGLFLHYEMHLTLDNKYLCIKQGASKHFHRDSASNMPITSKLAPLIKLIEARLGVDPAEEGRLAFKSFTAAVQELLLQDPGTSNMPELPFFLGGNVVPLVISFDATGFGSQQINTIALNNPYLSKPAQQLRIFGLDNCSDDRSGTTPLLGENLNAINERLTSGELAGELATFLVGSLPVNIITKTYVVLDVLALRHSEHIANSRWCGCTRDRALRTVPTIQARDRRRCCLAFATVRATPTRKGTLVVVNKSAPSLTW